MKLKEVISKISNSMTKAMALFEVDQRREQWMKDTGKKSKDVFYQEALHISKTEGGRIDKGVFSKNTISL